MKKLSCLLAVVALMTACYENAPVYFNRPLGRPAEGFDESFRGVYFDLDDMTQDWMREWGEKIESEGDSALFEKFLERMGVYDQEKDTASAPGKNVSNQDTLPIRFNEPVSETILGRAASYKDNVKYSAFVLGKVDLKFFTVDTTDSVHSYPLIQLSDTVKLTTYGDRYFLNFRSPLGWEIVQITQVDSGLVVFKAVRAPVLTDPPPNDLKSLEAAVDEHYPNLRAIVGEDDHVVGFKARLSNRKVLETLDKKEGTWLKLFRVL